MVDNCRLCDSSSPAEIQVRRRETLLGLVESFAGKPETFRSLGLVMLMDCFIDEELLTGR